MSIFIGAAWSDEASAEKSEKLLKVSFEEINQKVNGALVLNF